MQTLIITILYKTVHSNYSIEIQVILIVVLKKTTIVSSTDAYEISNT